MDRILLVGGTLLGGISVVHVHESSIKLLTVPSTEQQMYNIIRLNFATKKYKFTVSLDSRGGNPILLPFHYAMSEGSPPR
jgi:hypothetical protein